MLQEFKAKMLLHFRNFLAQMTALQGKKIIMSLRRLDNCLKNLRTSQLLESRLCKNSFRLNCSFANYFFLHRENSAGEEIRQSYKVSFISNQP